MASSALYGEPTLVQSTRLANVIVEVGCVYFFFRFLHVARPRAFVTKVWEMNEDNE